MTSICTQDWEQSREFRSKMGPSSFSIKCWSKLKTWFKNGQVPSIICMIAGFNLFFCFPRVTSHNEWATADPSVKFTCSMMIICLVSKMKSLTGARSIEDFQSLQYGSSFLSLLKLRAFCKKLNLPLVTWSLKTFSSMKMESLDSSRNSHGQTL